MEYLMILLDGAAPSFCYYDAARRDSEIISCDALERGIEYAEKHALGVTAIYGSETLPAQHRKLLDAVAHVKILPFREEMFLSGDELVVLDASQDVSFPHRTLNRNITHLVVMIHLQEVKQLYPFIENNFRFFNRISVIFKNLEYADEDMLNELRLTFQKFNPLLFNILSKEKFPEIGFVTDRITLREMNNCNAGVTHVTLAPDGNFYICPGFYHDRDSPVGSPEKGIHIKNPQLFQFSHAPVCNQCDCFQCKRCVYLNKRTTFETNTPSHVQCVVSHHERNLSGILIEKLQKRGHLINLPKIKPLFYLDPIESFK